MTTPTPYTRYRDYSQFQADNPNTDLNGADLDNDFDRVKTTTDSLATSLATIRRDDGGIKNGVVTLDSLSSDALTTLALDANVRGDWETATAYVAGDVVRHGVVDDLPFADAEDQDILINDGGVLGSFSPENTITWYDGITSLYARQPTVYAQRFLNGTIAPNAGSIVTDVFQMLSNGNTATTFDGTSLNYALIDDSYRAWDYCNARVLISRNRLRAPLPNTLTNQYDVGPEDFYQRKVPNTGNNSTGGWVHYQFSTPMVTKVFTTNAVATTNTSTTVTITMPNQFSVGDYVYFPEAITVGGVTFGGTSDQDSTNNNTYGSYYVQSRTDNDLTITVASAATSTATGGLGKSIYFEATGSLGNNPFSFTNGSGTVTVAHTGHNLSTGCIVFFMGATAAAGVTVYGDHAVTVVNDNSYTISLNATQDGAATANATQAGGGGSVTFAATSSNGEVTFNAVNYGARLLDGNVANGAAEFAIGLGCPPNQDGGNAQQWAFRKGGFYYWGETPPTDGGIAVRSLALKAPASSDLNTVLDTTTAAQNNAIKLKRGGTEKIQIVADSSNLFRIRDVPNTANFLSYNGTTAQLTLGAQGDIVITGAGGITTTTRVITKASATGGSGLNLPHGAAPSSPVDGDIWTTTAGLYVRINGSTVGPLS